MLLHNSKVLHECFEVSFSRGLFLTLELLVSVLQAGMACLVSLACFKSHEVQPRAEKSIEEGFKSPDRGNKVPSLTGSVILDASENLKGFDFCLLLCASRSRGTGQRKLRLQICQCPLQRIGGIARRGLSNAAGL